MENEKQLIEELENVFEELETLVDLDKDLLNDITGQSSEGGFFIGFGSGDLYDVLNREEVRPDGRVVSDHDNVDPILPEAVEQLNNVSDIIDEIKREGIGEGKQLDELMSETREFIQEEKRKVESEVNRLEQVDTSDAELGHVPNDYPPQIRQKADELEEIITELRNAEKGGHRDIDDVEDELQDLKESAREIHSMEDEEIEDLREFDKRAEKIRLMFEGNREEGDDIEGVITAFEKYADRHDDISKVSDLPTDKQINRGFPNKTFEQLPGHIQSKISVSSRQNLNPNNFMTENDLLLPEDNSSFMDFGLEQVYQNPVQSLESDIERIYSEQDEIEDTFESLENELDDIRDKFERIEGRYSDYIEIKEELSNTTVQTQDGVRNDVTARIEEAAALRAYDVQAPRKAKERLQEDFGNNGNVSTWIEEQIPSMIDDIEDIIYDSENSIVSEEHVEEEEIEDAIKDITRSIELLKTEFDDDSVVTGVPNEIQAVVDNILESLASIAEKCTDFEEEDDRIIEELREWAAYYEDLTRRMQQGSANARRMKSTVNRHKSNASEKQ